MKTALPSAGARRSVTSDLAATWRRTPWVWRGALTVAAAFLLMVGVLLRAGPDTRPAAPGSAAAAVADVPCTGGALHVAVEGSATNPGTEAAPLDLATALADQGPAKPCDTIWLHPGTYRGTFTSTLHGRPGKPIIVRALQADAPVIIDSAPSTDPAMTVRGTHTWYWGFEITNSSTNRRSAETGSWPADLQRGTGVSVRGTHLAFINLRVHDMARGFEVGEESSNIEISGCVIHHNGWEGPESSNGHAIETRNRTGTQRLRDNVIFDQYSHGILALSSETTPVAHLLIEGNTIFNNGRIGRTGLARDVLIGGAQRVQDVALLENATWGGGQSHVGYGRGCADSRIAGNYLVGSTALMLTSCTPEMHDNVVVTQYGTDTLPEGRANQYRRERPTGTVIRVRPNRHEAGLAYVTVYNWDRHPSVVVDADSLGLSAGDGYEVRDLQHDGEDAVVTATLDGRTVTLPLAPRPPRLALGAAGTVPSTLPEFTVFAVRKRVLARSPSGPTT